ncbi:MAG: ATP-binding cassette domain-containing protein [Firmicutes bacterium]|nr:ATP-binding cassette domain-containing protein [Bacillota bacterium]
MKNCITEVPSNRTEKKQKNKGKTREIKQGRKVFICLAWLVIWQLAAFAVGNELLLPSPLQTLKALGQLVRETGFYIDAAWTVARCLIAMLLSFAVGIAAAWAAYKHRTARDFLKLPVSFFKSVPVMAIIIYVILLVSSNFVAVIVCFIMCFPIVYTNVLGGLDAVSGEFLDVAAVYGLTEAQKRRLIYIPSIRPNLNAALRLVCGLSWKAVIAAEVLSIPDFSLGYEMMNAKYYLETGRLFAYIAAIVFLSILFEKLVMRAASCVEKNAAVRLKPHGEKKRQDLAPEIQLSGISKNYENKSVLSDVAITFESGTVTAVSGPSGRGKTTLAMIIAGLIEADAGRVVVRGGADVKLSFLFQEDRLLPWLTVYDNMALGRINDAGHELDAEIRTTAEALELTEVLFSLPAELSGGMRHRVSLGRTFLSNANLMILDEPFRGLDEELKDRIVERLWKETTKGKTVILISHNSGDCEKLSEKVVWI